MENNENETEREHESKEEEHDDPNIIEKPKKQQRKYVFTEARQLAFERCRQARVSKLDAKPAPEPKKPRVYKKKAKEPKVTVLEDTDSSSSEEEYVVQRVRNNRKAKKQVKADSEDEAEALCHGPEAYGVYNANNFSWC